MKLLAGLLLVFFGLNAKGQMHDAQWVLGDKVSVMDFRNDTLVNYAIQPFMPVLSTIADVCDKDGNLLYYTNGVYISGSDGNQIGNGGGLSPCAYTTQNSGNGLDIPQGTLFLPMPGSPRYYYLFHMSNDTLNSGRPATMYYSIIDELSDSGHGLVVSKNVIYFQGIFRDGGMTACKHANGRDWWIVVGNRYNTYYTFLLTPNGIGDTLTQTIGPSFHSPSDIAYSKFSQDGSKYVTSCNEGPVLVMDFDRCTGEFSNPLSLANPQNGAIVEFSPNARFVYATNSLILTQYDLWSPQPQHDSLTIYQVGTNDLAKMAFLQLAINSKLYISCFNGGYYFLHVINNPDGKGDSCLYVDTGYITLTQNTISLPNMVNYKLGPLVGSACDTITSIPEANSNNQELRMLPNPADKYVYVEMGMQGNYVFELLNEVGQVIARKETRQVDIFDTEALSNGVYFLHVIDKSNSNKQLTQKLVVQH